MNMMDQDDLDNVIIDVSRKLGSFLKNYQYVVSDSKKLKASYLSVPDFYSLYRKWMDVALKTGNHITPWKPKDSQTCGRVWTGYHLGR